MTETTTVERVREIVKYHGAEIKNEGSFSKVFPKESMCVGAFRYLYNNLNEIEDISTKITDNVYIIVYWE